MRCRTTAERPHGKLQRQGPHAEVTRRGGCHDPRREQRRGEDVGRRAAGHIMNDRGGSAAGPKPGAASFTVKLGSDYIFLPIRR
jgi:hypothetical protein